MPTTLPPETHIGTVHLTVRDLDTSVSFYEDALGFAVHGREDETAVLGPHAANGDRRSLLVLHHDPEAQPAYRSTGLYHFAVLVPSRLELAHVLRRFAELRTPVDGFADHLVSEAIYLRDPENNGIEVYRDRPRDEWRFIDGKVAMATDPIDLEGILAELEGHDLDWAGLHPDTKMGHIHLKVADIPAANRFYVEQVGFDLIQEMAGSASFISAGGYHHHIGMNTWESRGAMPPPANATGLRWYELRLPDAKTVGEVADRVRASGGPVEERDEGLLIRDPFQIGVMLTTD